MQDYRWTLPVVAGFLFVVVPLFTPDLYPFSSYPMFSDSPVVGTKVVVKVDDQEVDPSALGLASYYTANPAAKLGQGVPETLHQFGKALDEMKVRVRVHSFLRERADVSMIEIIQTFFEPGRGRLQEREVLRLRIGRADIQ